MNILTDQYLTFDEAAKLFPGRPNANAVWRWSRRGIKAANGQRVKLQATRIGRKPVTTTEWINEYLMALSMADADGFETVTVPTSSPIRKPIRRNTIQRTNAVQASIAHFNSN